MLKIKLKKVFNHFKLKIKKKTKRSEIKSKV